MKKLLLVVIAGVMIFGLYLISPYANSNNTDTVQIIQPEVKAIQDMVTLYGNVIDPDRKKLYPTGTSHVQQIYVSEGDYVKAGQLLMELEKDPSVISEESAAVSALVEIKETLQSGAIQDAETLLKDMIVGTSAVSKKTSSTHYSLYSPCDGMVMKLSAQEGSSVSGFLPCIEITQLNRLQVQVTAGEDVVGILQENMNCKIDVPAFSLEQLSGTVTKIDPYARETNLLTGNPVTQTNVYITPTEFPQNLRPGYRASAKVIVSIRENALLIPYEAILQDMEGGEYVLKVENNRIVKSNILTGSELENQAEVCDGLDKNTWVLMNPKAEWEGEMITFAAP